MTLDDLESYIESLRKEVDWLTVFNFVASVEASIRMDFDRRITARRKDPLSRSYRKWLKGLSPRKKKRLSLDEGGILEIVKVHADRGLRALIGSFRECLPARHWVGHGRYWNRPERMDRLTPGIVLARCRDLLDAWPD
ncbi:hypothetical protein [Aquisphaera insulae]|uniref:hypothetical protein n=1 Tax=Aquisphaera insulae TaxID=2712864 RepID=UPI0013EA0A20|nr:hypothetical protein [Aquisphaera insulae]